MSADFSAESLIARNTALLALMDAGGSSAPAFTEFRTGTRPASVGDAASGTLVATATWAYPSSVLQTDGSLLLNAGTQVMATADGAPTWARTYNGKGLVVFDADVTVPNGAGDFWLAPVDGDGSSTQIYAGGLLQLSSGYIV